jgi:SH3-like domain-containing protein
MKLINIYLFLILFIFTNISYASDKLPVPRFVSVKSSEVNVRAGPNTRYPLKFIIIKKGEPLEVIAEFEQWRKIRDRLGDEGWVHESMLGGKRYAIVKSAQNEFVYEDPDIKSEKIVMLEPNVYVDIIKCELDWCKIKINDFKGWMPKNIIWGVYPKELIK